VLSSQFEDVAIQLSMLLEITKTFQLLILFLDKELEQMQKGSLQK